MAHTTNYDPDYLRSNFCDAISYPVVNTDGSIGIIKELDPYSLDIHRLMESLTLFTSLKYTGQQFTTMVYNVYGNTTLIWLVLMYNGLLSRTELRTGMVLKFPLKTQTDAFIRASKITVPQGQVVVI